jgi:superfamily II DNA or RNA helicase
MNRRLCPFQEQAIKKVLDRYDDRDRVHLVALPTGAGKTRVGMAIAVEIIDRGGHVLWLAKNWELLRQALNELRDVHPHLTRECRRIGGCFSDLALPEGSDGRIFFTTLQTFGKRQLSAIPKRVRPSTTCALIWDEAHWAQDAPTGRKLTRTYLRKALIVGLTATPRESTAGTAEVAYSVPFSELVDAGRLAKPRVRSIATRVEWRPALADGEFACRSIQELGRSEARNAVILDELQRGRQCGEYHRVLIFACDIKHAKLLETQCNQRQIPARAVYHGLPRQEQTNAREDFRRGAVDVLINVKQLTEGFDAPDVDTVFLARPTTSQLLLAQMAGRGARRTPHKSSFWLVDFCDNLIHHADRLFRAAQLFPSALVKKSRAPTRPALQHDEPSDDPRFANLGLPGLGKIPYCEGQTFGVEIELTRPIRRPVMNRKWARIGRDVIAAMEGRVTSRVHPEPLGYHGNDIIGDPNQWYVTFDQSAGYEIVSPILVGRQGFLELQRASAALSSLVDNNRWGIRTDHRAGLHITLATRLNTAERLCGFVNRVQRLEPGLFTLVAPSRLYRFNGQIYDRRRRNRFCAPLRETHERVNYSELRLDAELGYRFRSLNLCRAFDDVELLEVRMHHGTTDFQKMALWICLWMQIFNRSRYAWKGDGVSGPVFDGDRRLRSREARLDDLFQLLEQEGIYLGPQFVGLLKERRREMRRHWERALPTRVRSWASAGWYRQPSGMLLPRPLVPIGAAC